MGSITTTHAESVTWRDAVTISGDTDVYTEGALEYAYAWGDASQTLNGVAFTASSDGTGAGTDVVITGASRAVAYAGTGEPWDGLSSEYKGILVGACYGTSVTVTLGNLTAGRVYAVQLWYHDGRAGFGGVTQTASSLLGNSVVMDKNSTEVAGGVGQYAIGVFVADGSTQDLLLTAAAFQAQINAVQVRDMGAAPLTSAITWGAATTISGDSDVSTAGRRVYAYDWGNNTRIVNGVVFSGSTSGSAGAGTDVIFSAGGVQNTTAYDAAGEPSDSLSAGYQDILRGAVYTTQFLVTLGNLTPGRDYAVQLWYHDARGAAGGGVSQTVSSYGSASVVLDKNSTEADGGVGQYTVGTFTADATNKVFFVRSATGAAAQINALQVRDVSATPLTSAITWGAATTIAGDSDVSNAGRTLYAYGWGNQTRIVNGVIFKGTNSAAGAGSDVVFSAVGGVNNYWAFGGSNPPWTDLSEGYRAILSGGDYTAAAYIDPLTVTLGNLVAGREYVVQVWLNDSRGLAGGITEVLAGSAGNSVVLDKNSTDSDGGVGQYSIGTFTADGPTKVFEVTSASIYHSQINALQVRDVAAPPTPTLIADYPMEGGWLGTGNKPLSNTPYNQDIIEGTVGLIGGGTAAPNSSGYLTLPGTDGYWQPASLIPMPADNYGFEIWARVAAADVDHTAGLIATLGSEAGAYAVAYRPPSDLGGGEGGWAFFRYGQAWVGPAGAFQPDAWTHLAVVRESGVTRFFVNAVVVTTESTPPSNNGFTHIGMGPGHDKPFKGDVDHMRVFIFEAGAFDPDTDLLYEKPTAGTVFIIR